MMSSPTAHGEPAVRLVPCYAPMVQGGKWHGIIEDLIDSFATHNIAEQTRIKGLISSLQTKLQNLERESTVFAAARTECARIERLLTDITALESKARSTRKARRDAISSSRSTKVSLPHKKEAKFIALRVANGTFGEEYGRIREAFRFIVSRCQATAEWSAMAASDCPGVVLIRKHIDELREDIKNDVMLQIQDMQLKMEDLGMAFDPPGGAS